VGLGGMVGVVLVGLGMDLGLDLERFPAFKCCSARVLDRGW